MIITIDGPSGVGKSSLSKALARHLGFGQIDSGAMYRAATLHCLRQGVDFADVDALSRAASTARIELRHLPEGGDEVLLNGEVVDAELRDPEISRRIANVADLRLVRDLVNEAQRLAARGRDLVLDGRDTGTVVFPNADIKIYLTADVEARGRRRHEQMVLTRGAEHAESLDRVIADLAERDRRDRSRPFGALKPAEDAILVDSSTFTYAQGLSELIRIVEEHPAYRARLGEPQRVR